MWAVSKRKLQLSKFLVAKGSNINHKSNKGFSVWGIAVDIWDTETLKFFIESSVDNIDSLTDNKQTLLSKALDNRDKELAEYLISKGANINALIGHNLITYFQKLIKDGI